MEHSLAIGIAAVLVFGVGAQWLANVLKIPSILLLLVAGFVAGPVTHIVNPDELLGDLLFPLVSLAVGILLFEGGLGLRFEDIHNGRAPVMRLVTIGVLVTWAIGWVASRILITDSNRIAALLGAILVVSGPTVVIPLLRLARPRDPAASILRWEGIVIDPIGATLAIVVLEAAREENEAVITSLFRVLRISATGIAAGLIGAAILTEVLRRHLVPDRLHNPVTLMLVVASFEVANIVSAEAGLFATTVMGVVLANQRRAPMAHIREFEEDLGTLIIAALFILLAARIELDALREVLVPSIVLVLILVFIARPLAVYASTVGTSLHGRQRAYLAALAPRGIVAASVASVFALELEEGPLRFSADVLVPVTFLVIVGTVLIYGTAATPLARRFKVARAEPRGVALVGAQEWVLDLADELVAAEIPVLIVATDPDEISQAVERGMLTYTGRLDSEDLLDAIDGVGINQAIAVSRTMELNAYGMTRLVEALGRANVFHLPPTFNDTGVEPSTSVAVFGRRPFSAEATQRRIGASVDAGGDFVTVDEHNYDEAALQNALPLVSIDPAGRPVISISESLSIPATGYRTVVLTATDGFNLHPDDS